MKKSQSISQLMESVLSARFRNDLKQQQQLCEALGVLAEAEADSYARCFSQVYILDCFLALGNYTDFAHLLTQIQPLCEQNHYNGLLPLIYNLASLYFKEINNEQLATSYILKGLTLLKAQEDPVMESKLLNNLGICFYTRGDLVTAQEYFHKAYETLAPHLSPETYRAAQSYLSNLAETSQINGDREASQSALNLYNKIPDISENACFQRAYIRCGHLAICGKRKKSIGVANQMIQDGIAGLEDKHFVRGALITLSRLMLDIDSPHMAGQFLTMLRPLCGTGSLNGMLLLLQLEIRYYEKYGTEAEQRQVYKRYYELSHKIALSDDAIRAESLVSTIALTKALMEREEILRKNNALQKASHLDSLTHLYNRRYLSKLISKILLANRVTRLGFILLDVDYFKPYNDHYGHLKGDQALQSVAGLLQELSVNGIYASRYGGDEFMCLCVNLEDAAVEAYIQKLRDTLEKKAIPHASSPCSPYITLSVGWCNEPYAPAQADSDKLIALADRALYEVKELGRNKVCRKTID